MKEIYFLKMIANKTLINRERIINVPQASQIDVVLD